MAEASPGSCDLGHSVTRAFLFTERFTLSHFPDYSSEISCLKGHPRPLGLVIHSPSPGQIPDLSFARLIKLPHLSNRDNNRVYVTGLS